MLTSFTSYNFLIFVSLDYTEFNVLANSNGFVDFYQILYHTSLNVITRMCKDSVRFINYFENRNGNTYMSCKIFMHFWIIVHLYIKFGFNESNTTKVKAIDFNLFFKDGNFIYFVNGVEPLLHLFDVVYNI